MAEPVDYFMQGTSLGMKAAQAAEQTRQFQTNLAERARQFNESFRLEEDANKAAVARDNAYTSKLNYELTQQQETDNRVAEQLQILKDYKTSVRAADSQQLLKLPMPPPGLHGEYLTEAQGFYTAIDADRKSDAAFKRLVQEREDLVDLVENFSLDPRFLELAENFELTKQDTRVGPVPLEIPKTGEFSVTGPIKTPQDELREAFMRRSVSKAESIASEFGIDPSEFSDVRVLLPFLNNRGDLDEDRFRARVAALPQATKTVSSRTVSSTGAISETINLKKPSNKKEPAEVRLERIKTLLPEVKDILGEINVPRLEALLKWIETGEGLEGLVDDDETEEEKKERERLNIKKRKEELFKALEEAGGLS